VATGFDPEGILEDDTFNEAKAEFNSPSALVFDADVVATGATTGAAGDETGFGA
jgi:hypothetical protein